MSLDQLQAFTVTDDHARQEEVWNSLPGWSRYNDTIRRTLMEEAARGTDKRVKIIGGLEVYEAAGRDVRRDLFDDRNTGYATDIALLERLVAEKLEAEAEKVRAEGWSWVECCPALPHDAFGMKRVYPETVRLTDEQQAELDRLTSDYDDLSELIEAGAADEDAEAKLDTIKEQIDGLEALTERYSPEHLAAAGAYVTMSNWGELDVERGLVRIEPEAEEPEAGEQVETTTETADAQSGSAFSLSNALVEDLTAQKTAALRVELANNHDIALAAVVHAMLLDVAYTYSGEQSALQIRLSSEWIEGSMKQPQNCKALEAMESLRETFGHRIPGNPSDLWNWCMDQSRDELLALLAYAAAHSVNAVRKRYDDRAKGREHANVLAHALNVDMTAWFEPTAENYFERINKTGIELAVAEARGEDFAAGISGMKKADAAAYAERSVKGTGWLPEPVRIAPIIDSDTEEDDAQADDNPSFPRAA